MALREVLVGYDWSLAELRRLAEVEMTSCPLDEEASDWLYVIENAALEARLRLDAGHYGGSVSGLVRLLNRLNRQTAIMRRVALARYRVQDSEVKHVESV